MLHYISISIITGGKTRPVFFVITNNICKGEKKNIMGQNFNS